MHARTGPISLNKVAAVQEELDGFAHGRWSRVNVSLRDQGMTLDISIEISRDANELARDGYCRVIRRVSQRHLEPGQEWFGKLLVNRAKVKTCPR